MKKYRMMLLLAVLSLVLTACTEQQKNKNVFIEANEGKNKLSKEDLEANEVYRWTLTEDIEAIAVMEEGEKVTHEQSFTFAEAGEETFYGHLSLYLLHADIAEGFLQYTMEDIVLNTTQGFEETEIFQDRPVIGISEIVEKDLYLRSMWHFAAGELQPLQFGKATRIPMTGKEVKWIDDQYVQVHFVAPYGVGLNESKWQFTTWEWTENQFTLKNESVFVDTLDHQLGKHVTAYWLEEDRPLPFEMAKPATYTITKTALPSFEQGGFMAHEPKIGDPLVEEIFNMPPHTEQKVRKEGATITFVDGFTYQYDPDTFNVTAISLNGQQLTSSLPALRKVFGEANANSYDVEEAVYIEKYAVGDYRVVLTYRKDEQRYKFQLTEK